MLFVVRAYYRVAEHLHRTRESGTCVSNSKAQSARTCGNVRRRVVPVIVLAFQQLANVEIFERMCCVSRCMCVFGVFLFVSVFVFLFVFFVRVCVVRAVFLCPFFCLCRVV